MIFLASGGQLEVVGERAFLAFFTVHRDFQTYPLSHHLEKEKKCVNGPFPAAERDNL